MSLETCQATFDKWLKDEGYSNCQQVIRKWNRARLEKGNGERPARIKFKHSLVKKLYNKQRGICPRCKQEMALNKYKLHIDHWDCNAEDFNAESNLRVLHSTCNLEKGANSIYQESKATNQTVLSSVEAQNSIHREPIEDEI